MRSNGASRPIMKPRIPPPEPIMMIEDELPPTAIFSRSFSEQYTPATTTKAPLYSIPFESTVCVSSHDITKATAASISFTPEKGYTLYSETPHLVVILDRSGSMEVGDKIQNARAAVRELCRLCTEKHGEHPIKISINAFDDTATIAMTPTLSPTPEDVDVALCSMMPRGGTDFAVGLQKAMEVISADEPTVVVLFTDGQDGGKMRNGDNSVLNTLMAHSRFLIHTVAIGNDADNDFLRRIANSMRCTGESVQVNATGIPSVMAALHASVVQSAVGPSAVEINAMDAGGKTVERYCMPVVIQIAEDADGDPMPIEAGFVIPIGVTHVQFTLKFCDADIVATERIPIVAATIDVEKASQAASKFFVPYIAAAAAKALKADDADAALAHVTQAMETVRVMSELPGTITSELEDIRRRVEVLGIQLRSISDACTRTNTLAAIDDLAAGALETIRVGSGAMPLVETESRSMSHMARTQSDAAYAHAVGPVVGEEEVIFMRS